MAELHFRTSILIFCIIFSNWSIHVNGLLGGAVLKTRDVQTVVQEKVLDSVNADFDDVSFDTDKDFSENMPSFSSSSVITLKGSAPERRQAARRALGGMVLNLGQFSGEQNQYVPRNVFGADYDSHLIDDSCQSLGFPFVCRERKLVDERFTCPVDVPYCQRIPCNNNNDLHRDPKRCMRTPGCCFDQVLFNYRRYYGQTVLPQVPVCHLAVRNEHFHNMARKFADRYRNWNPLLTNCLIKTNRNEIERNSIECATLDIFEYFGFKPKHAGWSDILPKECGLIGGCWRHGIGCFYPPRITNLQLRSTYTHPRGRPYSPFDLYGQPMCLPMDPYAKSGDFLNQYHQCLSSGCELDPAVTPSVILHHLHKVSSELPKHLINSYKYEVMLGTVRPDNWREQLNNFKKYGKIHPNAYTPKQGGPNAKANLPPQVLAQLGKFPGPTMQRSMPRAPIYQQNQYQQMPHLNFHQRSTVPLPQTPVNPFQQITRITNIQGIYPAPPSQFRNPNPNAFITSHTMNHPPIGPVYNQQPRQHGLNHVYSPTDSKIRLYPVPCPFTVVRIPNFPPLDGKVTDCCDRNLCYTPRFTARRQYSGAAAYWGPWGFWSRCSVSCNNSVQKRYRTCIGPNQNSCGGPREEKRACYGIPSCRSRFSRWSQWSRCSRSCDGARVRTRYCAILPCQGSTRERESCNTECSKDDQRTRSPSPKDRDEDDDDRDDSRDRSTRRGRERR